MKHDQLMVYYTRSRRMGHGVRGDGVPLSAGWRSRLEVAKSS
ncbi:hypothetical protein [Laspinema palackyanum]